MREEKLNMIVERYKNGDETALNKLCKMFLPIILKHSEDIWYQIESQVDFECRCLVRIKRALSDFEPEKGKIKSWITGVILKEKYDFLARRKRNHEIVSIDKPVSVDREGDEVMFEVPDVLADVENEIIGQASLNEKVALLAKDDSRRMAILKAWTEGETNDLKLAKELATTFPDTAESGHRRFIQRFRIECQKRLATV